MQRHYYRSALDRELRRLETDDVYYVGLMSGTSMDAVDAVVVQLTASKCSLLATHREPFPQELRTALLTLRETSEVELDALGQLDVRVGELFAQAAEQVRTQAGLPTAAIRAIGSHGQTVRHRPRAPHPFSLQLGNPAVIAEHTRITTVADFRSGDIAAGGEGAPLVTAFHCWMFRSSDRSRAIVNIGGIANLSYLPADDQQPVLAFDTGPGNALLDTWVQRHRRRPYDAEGRWAASGHCLPELLERLCADAYFKAPPPKSTGFEHFNLGWLEQHVASCRSSPEPRDVQATLAALTVRSIADAVHAHARGVAELYVCGGGSHNTYLMGLLGNAVNEVTVDTTEALGLPADWVEAAAFAWLAHQALEQRVGNVPSATGARREVILGGIYRV